MANPRIRRLAEILVGYSVAVRRGDTIRVCYDQEASDLALEVARRVLLRGAEPLMDVCPRGAARRLYRYASPAVLRRPPEVRASMLKRVGGHICIDTDVDRISAYCVREAAGAPPSKIAVVMRALRPLRRTMIERGNYVICGYPSRAHARDAGMLPNAFEDFFFRATNRDWRAESLRMERARAALDAAEHVRVVARGTDISFSVAGKRAVKADGHYNMPDGEVFTEPVKRSVEGRAAFSFPAVKWGREVSGVVLEFRGGRVVRAGARKGGALLAGVLNTDRGAKYAGEFGIGTNYAIDRPVKNILFDEKMGGTVHLALGASYPETGGENVSAVHSDFIIDMRRGGELYFDGRLVQKDGKFTLL